MQDESKKIVPVERPGKIDSFLMMAWIIKEQSCDAQTKHGCVITCRKNRVLGTGYNSFPREVDNTKLPNVRPDKYPWMIHSEENAVSNCVHSPREYDEGGIAYVTGLCCFPCTRHLWQNGVTKVYQMDRISNMIVGTSDENLKKEFCEHTGMELHVIKPDFSLFKKSFSDAIHLGFFHSEFENLGKKLDGYAS